MTMIIKYNLTAIINPEDEMKLRYELDDVALKYSGALSSGHETSNDSSEKIHKVGEEKDADGG